MRSGLSRNMCSCLKIILISLMVIKRKKQTRLKTEELDLDKIMQYEIENLLIKYIVISHVLSGISCCFVEVLSETRYL